MIDNFDELAATGVIDVPALCELYAGTRVVGDASVAKVKAELECARRQSCKTVAEKSTGQDRVFSKPQQNGCDNRSSVLM
jgi:hypothetical protein